MRLAPELAAGPTDPDTVVPVVGETHEPTARQEGRTRCRVRLLGDASGTAGIAATTGAAGTAGRQRPVVEVERGERAAGHPFAISPAVGLSAAGSNGDSRRRTVNLLSLGACLVAGLAVWGVFVLGKVEPERVPLGFWVAMVGVAALASLLVDEGIVAVFAGPTVVAWWTAPRGDDDGLWILLIPLIVFVGGVAIVLVGAVRKLVPHARLREAIRRAAGRHPLVLGGVVLVGIVVVVQLFVSRWPDPHPDLERLMPGFPVPESTVRMRPIDSR